MTLNQYIETLKKFSNRTNSGELNVVFHDVDGAVRVGETDICVDGTCSEDEPEIVRITMVE